MTLPVVARSPRYWLRRQLAIRTLKSMRRGSVLDIGCGTGDLLVALARHGYHGVGLEISPTVADIARRTVGSVSDQFQIILDPGRLDGSLFDYVCAFEVLEHLENDLEELREWIRWLRPGGTFLASIPAHIRLWTAADEAVGHHRRYERDEVERLFIGAGLAPEAIWSYGFPLTSLTRRFRSLHATAVRPPGDKRSRTLASATASTARAPLVVGALLHVVALLGHAAQLCFLRTDLGDGYFVVARREAGG